MKRFITIGLLIVICFILQSTVFQVLALANVVPNLLVIVTAAIGYMRGRKEGLVTGLVCGLLVDMAYGDVIGLYGMIYMFVGYLNGLCNKVYYRDEITIPIILVGVSDLIYSILFYLFGFLLRNRLNLFFYFRRIMLPELVYTVAISILLYKGIHSINQWLEKSEAKEV